MLLMLYSEIVVETVDETVDLLMLLMLYSETVVETVVETVHLLMLYSETVIQIE